VVGSFYAFAVVRRISVDGPTFDRVTHYKVIVGCFVTLALPLLFGLSDFLTWVLYFSAFAATGMPMWLEYETRPPPKRAQ
jgi:hypothetical protein